MLERRSLLAGLAAIPAAWLPTCASCAPTVETRLAFDPSAFVADVKAAGYDLIAYYPVPRGGEPAGPPGYFIRPKGRGFGAAYTAVMAKWRDAMDACPDYVEQVADHVFGQLGRDAA